MSFKLKSRSLSAEGTKLLAVSYFASFAFLNLSTRWKLAVSPLCFLAANSPFYIYAEIDWLHKTESFSPFQSESSFSSHFMTWLEASSLFSDQYFNWVLCKMIFVFRCSRSNHHTKSNTSAFKISSSFEEPCSYPIFCYEQNCFLNGLTALSKQSILTTIFKWNIWGFIIEISSFTIYLICQTINIDYYL